MSHHARFTGYKSVKRYGFSATDWEDALGEMYEYHQPIPYEPWEDTNLIYEGDLDDPVLQVNQSIYIHTLKTSVTVNKVERSTDGVYTYLTSYEIERTEDKATQTTKAHAEHRKKLADEKWNRMGNNRSEYQEYKPSWWERLKDMFS